MKKTKKMNGKELNDFVRSLSREEYIKNDYAKFIASKAIRATMHAMGHDADFVEREFRDRLEDWLFSFPNDYTTFRCEGVHVYPLDWKEF